MFQGRIILWEQHANGSRCIMDVIEPYSARYGMGYFARRYRSLAKSYARDPRWAGSTFILTDGHGREFFRT